MSRDYWFAFGSQPSQAASLSPTFITFINSSGTTYAPPAITETYAGSGLYKVNYGATQTMTFVMDGATTGLDSSVRYIAGVFDPQDMFGSTLVTAGNNTFSLIALGMTNIAIGNSNIALGMSNIALGNTNVAIGTTAVGIGNATGSTLVAQGATIVAIGNTLSGLGSSFSFILAGIGSTGSTFGSVSSQPDSVFGYLKRVVEFLEGDQTYAKATGALTYKSRGSSLTLANKTVADSISSTTRT